MSQVHKLRNRSAGVSGYTAGCRCGDCRSGWSSYRKAYRKKPGVIGKEQEYKSRPRTRELVRLWAHRPDVIARRHERNREYRKDGCYRRQYEERRAYINSLKVQRGCVDCGYRANPVALQFDHVRGKKEFVIAAKYLKRRWDDVLAEIEKCEVRCANCHAIVTFARKQQAS